MAWGSTLPIVMGGAVIFTDSSEATSTPPTG